MKKCICLALLFCAAAAGVAAAGQFRINRPPDQRRRPHRPGRRESRLEIVNRDDRGYAIDVDHRRNRLELQHRSRGDIFVPGNSGITLVFDDDDDWRIHGDGGSLEINIREGRTTTLQLETRKNRNQVGLFGTVDNGGRRNTAQLFGYAVRPGHNPPPPPPHRPPPPRPVPPPPPPPRPGPGHRPPPSHDRGPSKGEAIGAIIGGLIGGLLDDDKDDHRRR
ncbi:MAG: hypothetical protein LBJ46_02990 [Planctomycetota bacterium]|jgi:hypothetical protein|nr:hypothetical protein [Planctomycetota bacterium]